MMWTYEAEQSRILRGHDEVQTDEKILADDNAEHVDEVIANYENRLQESDTGKGLAGNENGKADALSFLGIEEIINAVKWFHRKTLKLEQIIDIV